MFTTFADSMTLKPKILFCLIAFLSGSLLFSQDKIDLKFIDNIPDSLKADTLNRLAKKYRLNDFNKSLFYCKKALEVALRVNDSIQVGNAYNGIGNENHLQGNYEEALKNYLLALTVFENLKSVKGLGSTSINLGVLNADKGNHLEALKYYHKAAIYAEKSGNLANTASVYNNIGIVFNDLGNADSALIYGFKALEIRKKMNSDDVQQTLGSSYSNIAVIYVKQKKFAEAEKYYLLSYNEDVANDDLNSLSKTLSNLGDLYAQMGDNAKALRYLKTAEDSAKKIEQLPLLVDIYWNFAMVYKKTENYKLASVYMEKYATLKDSIDGVKNHEVIEELQARYSTEKKEQEIVLLNKDNLLKESQLSEEKRIKYFVFGFAAVVLFSAVFIFNAYRNKKRANGLLKEKNREIQKQKNLLSEKNNEILDSIKYAKHLQDAIMPPVSLVKEHLPGAFIFYKPKDIVAGDFYWFHAAGDKLFFAAADCTGHGVPGAMVSMVCANALNRAVKEFGLTEPGKILDTVTKLVIETYEKSESGVSDGMDISMVCMAKQKENYEVKWCGANNPLWFIKAGNFNEIKADKQPVGKFENHKPFTTHTLSLVKGDKIFLLTDGFADQFGGQKGKKYKYAPLKEFLVKHSSAGPDEQKLALETEFAAWRGKLEQVDDVTILGVNL